MSLGGGQLVVLEAVTSAGAVSPLAKLYHYAEGTTTLKNIYSDEALTSALAQPFVSDSAGRFVFYAKGAYKFRIDTAADVTLDTWDNFWVGPDTLDRSFGTATPAAPANSKGKLFSVIDASNRFLGLYVNENTAWKQIIEYDASGNMVIDNLISKTMPVYNVKHSDWGAIGDGSNDDTAEIQLAINAIQTAGTGVLYFPAGTYKISSALTVADCHIWIQGDGSGQSIILQTGGDGTNGFTITQSSVTNQVIAKNITIRTSAANTASGVGMSVNWVAGGTLISNFTSDDLRFDSVTSSTEYWYTGLLLDDTHNPRVTGVVFVGKESDHSSASAGIQMITASGNIMINDCALANVSTGINMLNTANDATIDSCFCYNVTKGINFNQDSIISNHRVHHSMIDAYQNGIIATKAKTGHYTGNTIYKREDSSDSFIGISLADTCDNTHVEGNTILDGTASTGTFIGIQHSSGVNVKIDNNTLVGSNSSTPIGISIAAGVSEFSVTNNRVADMTTGITVLSGASDNYIISGNNLEGCTTGINDSGTGVVKILKNNIPTAFVTIASATTLTPSSVSDYWDVTGSTTVTTIPASWVGRVIYIKWASGALFDVTHGSGNILLNNGTNITTAGTGYLLMLLWDGTNWNQPDTL